MPLVLEKKKELVEEISNNLDESKLCMMVDVIGLTVAQVKDLRRKLLAKDVKSKVYKNRLIKRAIEGKEAAGELASFIDELKGPTALAFTNGDPIVASKVFTDFAEENEILRLKGAVYENSYWNESDIKGYSKLGSMGAIYGRLIQQMSRIKPTRQLRSCCGPGSNLSCVREELGIVCDARGLFAVVPPYKIHPTIITHHSRSS